MMIFSPQDILELLGQYKYLILFPIIIFEGPIITVIAGFLVYLGLLNGYITYSIIIVGDVLGDVLHYLLGRWFKEASWFIKVANIFGYDDRREKQVENLFLNHTAKTLLISKFTHGVAGFAQIVAGIVKLDFWQFLKYAIIGTIPKSLIMFFLGYYLGNYYLLIDKYLNRFSSIVMLIITLFILYLVTRNYVKKRFPEV